MITLTIRPQMKRKDRFSVFLEEEYLFSLSRYTYRKLGEPKTVQRESVEAFRKECEFPEQYNYCLELLSRRGYSSKELRDKLAQRNVSSQTADEVLARLQEEKLVSDEEFLRSFVRSRQLYHKQGFYKIRQDLARKGIALSEEEYDKEEEQKTLKELVKKLISQNVERQKIIRRLLTKGFRYGDVVSALQEVCQTTEEPEYEEFHDYES
ncbi:MAG: regulatory protein RecX [Clostridia bacterium]|nr:regulatory protein RecX [Clostridia bacterium]